MKKTTQKAIFVLKTGQTYTTDYSVDATWKAEDFTDSVIHKIIVKRFLLKPLVILLSGANIASISFEPSGVEV